MNYIYILIEVILVFLLMIVSYKVGKKDGLFTYLGFVSSMTSVVIFKSVDILSFEIDLAIPLLMGVFIVSNIIIQRYGIDEIKRIIKTFIFPYIVTIAILCLTSLMTGSEFNLLSNNIYDSLFGYNLDNLRLLVSAFLSIGFMLWYNAYVYYYIRKNKNKYLFSNIGSILIVQFIESVLFILIAYIGTFEFNMIFGMIMVRYLVKVVIGIISLLPFGIVLKMKS